MTEKRVKLIRRDYKTAIYHEHYCPGCKYMHQIAVEQPFSNGAQWKFDGNFEAPTFSPSVNIMPNNPKYQCHYFIKAGKIQFLGDCFHELRGKTVDLPYIPLDHIDDE